MPVEFQSIGRNKSSSFDFMPFFLLSRSVSLFFNDNLNSNRRIIFKLRSAYSVCIGEILFVTDLRDILTIGKTTYFIPIIEGFKCKKTATIGEIG